MPIDFDGTSGQLIDFGSAAALDDMAAITILIAVHCKGAGDSTFPDMISKCASTGANGWRFQVNTVVTNNQVQFIVDYDGASDMQKVSANSVLPINGWAIFIVTWDGGTAHANCHIYKDGVEVTYSGSNTNGVGNRVTDAAQTLKSGARTSTTAEFKGMTSEIAVWNVVLTAAEIEILSKSKIKGMPLLIQPAALKLYAPMNEVADGGSAAGVSILDRSGNGSNGTVTGAPTGRAEDLYSYPAVAVMADAFDAPVGGTGRMAQSIISPFLVGV